MLKFVVANIQKQALEAVVTDRNGRARKIRYGWKTRERQPAPPENWIDSVYGECDYRIEQEHRRGIR